MTPDRASRRLSIDTNTITIDPITIHTITIDTEEPTCSI